MMADVWWPFRSGGEEAERQHFGVERLYTFL
jgi:hypothetical protein